MGRQFEYLEIVLVALFGPMLRAQQVIGDSELAGGEQIVLVAVVLEGSRLADKPVYDMTVVDIVAVLSVMITGLAAILTYKAQVKVAEINNSLKNDKNYHAPTLLLYLKFFNLFSADEKFTKFS